ncbi:MAG: rhodanese-like domain-containing protein [Mariniphaga sp.]|nr:rhodanese-like domain-containing protein [Mariniphaga sp.]
MDFRIKLSVLLVGIGVLLAFLPAPKNNVLQLSPQEMLEQMQNNENYLTVDQVARFVNNEDSTIQLIDVRSPEEFKICNIPGSINIPMEDILNRDWQGYLNQNKVKNIFYSNGDRDANYAQALTTGFDYKNNFVMTGGLNEWYKTIMLTEFKGESITPRENALFENRFKARKTFTQINSLPDSLKFQFLEARRLEETQLDGGCE